MGLNKFDEKEVDTNIVIRAVDAYNDYEADSLCIVSSDQDFMPLHRRGEKAGVSTYHADIAKFATPEFIGKKIRELGDRHILVGIDPLWPTRAVLEACGHDPFNGVPVERHIEKGISQIEFSALCQLNNEMNSQYTLKPVISANGAITVEVTTPD